MEDTANTADTADTANYWPSISLKILWIKASIYIIQILDIV
jgi:hypothetical protein